MGGIVLIVKVRAYTIFMKDLNLLTLTRFGKVSSLHAIYSCIYDVKVLFL